MSASALCLSKILADMDGMPKTAIEQIVDKYVGMNIAHPFMEGNGRSTKIWLDQILIHSSRKCID